MGLHACLRKEWGKRSLLLALEWNPVGASAIQECFCFCFVFIYRDATLIWLTRERMFGGRSNVESKPFPDLNHDGTLNWPFKYTHSN